MLHRVTHAQVESRYRLALTFNDGVQGVVDLEPLIAGRRGVFQPLHDVEYFARVTVDPDAGTVVWPNGVDVDPDVLYQAAVGTL